MAIAPTPELRTKIRQAQGPATLAHEQRTAVIARELAAAHGVDPDRAELAALLHDIADHYSDGDLLREAGRYGIPISPTEAQNPRLLHGPVGAEILRHEYGIRDEELLDAVRGHVAGGPHMSTLAKVLFVADKVEPQREHSYPGRESVLELARENLDCAMLKLYARQMNELLDAGHPLDERMIATRNILLEQIQAATCP